MLPGGCQLDNGSYKVQVVHQPREKEKNKEEEEVWDEVIPQPTACSSLPVQVMRWLSLPAIVLAWLWLTSLECKVRAVMVALTFAIIEFHFRAITCASSQEHVLATLCKVRPAKKKQELFRAVGKTAREQSKSKRSDFSPGSPSSSM